MMYWNEILPAFVVSLLLCVVLYVDNDICMTNKVHASFKTLN